MWQFREHKNWNEYHWEREIRRDERRISRYFSELPSCIDLPGEEEMIFNQISGQSDLVPVSGGMQDIRNWSYISGSDDEEEPESDNSSHSHRPGHNCVDILDHLTTDWNILTTTFFDQEPFSHAALGIACAYARLTARTADFVDVDYPENPDARPLKITLGKRCLADLNILVNALRNFQSKCSASGAIDSQIENLSWVRSRIVELLLETQKA